MPTALVGNPNWKTYADSVFAYRDNIIAGGPQPAASSGTAAVLTRTIPAPEPQNVHP